MAQKEQEAAVQDTDFNALGEAIESFFDKGFEPEDEPSDDKPGTPPQSAKKPKADEKPDSNEEHPDDPDDSDIPEDDDDGEPSEDPDDTDEDDAEDDDDEGDLVIASDDAVVKTKDGRKIKVSELRDGYLRQEHFTVKTQEVAKREKDVDTATAAFAETKQQLATINVNLLGYLSSILPEEPQLALYREDPTAYTDQKIQRDTVLTRMNEVNNHLQMLTKQEGEKVQAMKKDAMARSGKALADARPFLKDPEKRTEYFSGLTAGAERYYGVEKKEVMDNTDHRVFLILEDAIRYRKLKAKKPKAKRDAQAKPAMRAGTRRSGKAGKIKGAEGQIAAAAKKGRIEDTAGILGALLLGEG